MGTATNPGSWINGLFPRFMTNAQLQDCFNIWWRVCLMHIPPRDQRFEFEREFGAQQLEAVLNHRPLSMGVETRGGGQQIMFVFPERWLTTQEEHVFVPILKEHPQIRDAKLSIIDIVTKSPLIVGNFCKDDVRIVSNPDEYDMGIHKSTRAVWDTFNKRGP